MKTSSRVSRLSVVSLVLGLCAIASAIWVRQRIRSAPDGGHPDLARLSSERSRMEAAAAELPGLRAQAAQRRAIPDNSARPWQVSAGWSITPAANSPSERVVLRRSAPGIDWPGLVATVTDLERRPGWRIATLEIRSRGSRHQREIAAVEIVLEHATATPGQPADVRPPAVPASAGGATPAAPRKVGRGPSLRRPSASAGRQAARLRLPARPALRSDPTLRAAPEKPHSFSL